MKMTVRTTKETLQMDILPDKNTKGTTHRVTKATAMTFHPHGSIRKRWKYTDDQSYDKSNAYQGNEVFDQKSSEKHYNPKHSNERFPGLHPSDYQSYKKK